MRNCKKVGHQADNMHAAAAVFRVLPLMIPLSRLLVHTDTSRRMAGLASMITVAINRSSIDGNGCITKLASSLREGGLGLDQKHSKHVRLRSFEACLSQQK